MIGTPRYALYIFIYFFLGSCQTIAPSKKIALPATVSYYFRSCFPAGGLNHLKVMKANEAWQSFEIEWVAHRNRSWEAEVPAVLGPPVMRLEYSGSNLKVNSRLNMDLPELLVNKQDYLEIDGYKIGIKAAELPCILNGRLPSAWLNHVDNISVDGQQTTLSVDESGRSIEVSFDSLRTQNPRICSEINWWSYLGFFSHSILWCVNQGKKKDSSIHGIDDFVVQWVSDDEQ